MFSLEDIKLILSGKVDSRVKVSAGSPVKTHPTLRMERTYCVKCTRPYGWVSYESYEFIRTNNIIVVCDDCVFTNGAPPLEQVPEGIVPTILEKGLGKA